VAIFEGGVMRRIVLMPLVAMLIASVGCATATRLHTTPEGAIVHVNGKLIGNTPIVYDNDPGLPRRYHVQVTKPGYESLDFYLDTRLSWLWGYVGFVTLVPYLWAWSLEREYVFVMQQASQPNQPPPPSSEPDSETYLRP
jgi:hypothetical protein